MHPGYLSTNAPLRHVSTSRAGTYVAVAGSRGLALYSRPTNRWRLFGNMEQVQYRTRCFFFAFFFFTLRDFSTLIRLSVRRTR